MPSQPKTRDDPTRPVAAMFEAPPYETVDTLEEIRAELPDLLARHGYAPLDDRPKRFEVDAKLWEGQFQDGRLRASRVRHFRSREAVQRQHRRIRETCDRSGLQLREAIDWFAYGTDGIPGAATGDSPLTRAYIPLIPGPATRQQYWADYFATSAKSFEAFHHDPLAHRAVELLTEFVLGRAVKSEIPNDQARKAWETFWRDNDMDRRLEDLVKGLSVFGELVIRYFPMGRGSLAVRSLDPATIYEIVTDPEDWETVYFFHQQYQTRSQLFAPPAGRSPMGTDKGGAVSKYVVRQIPAAEIDHVRVNVTDGEVRGRPDLFPALGYLKRLRDLITSRVIKADMEARMVWKLTAKGNQADIDRVRQSLFPNGKPPAPGSIAGLNDAADLDPMQFTAATGGTGGDPDMDALMNLVAVGLGVPKEYLGISGRATRANALVATEPAAKRFEDRQKVVERLLHRMAERVFDAAGIPDGDARRIEFTFPEIVSEDRSAKLKDLAFAESMGWIAKQTAAEAAAGELGDTTFDFDDEQKRIAEEWDESKDDTGADGEQPHGDGKIRRPLISSQYRQTPKIDPTRPPTSIEDLPPGVLASDDGSQPDATDGADGPTPATRGGMPADENPLSDAGAKNIRADDGTAKESISLTPASLGALVREAVAAGRAPRRRPDDPAYRDAAKAYRDDSARNLEQLVDEASPKE